MNSVKISALRSELSEQKQGVRFIYSKGQIIYFEGLRPVGVFLLVSGKIKTYKTSSGGRESMLGITNKGSLLGYNDLLKKEFYSANTIAIEDSEVIFFPKNTFYSLLTSNPDLFKNIQKL
jgi:CRP/FNR family transcriptional regulator